MEFKNSLVYNVFGEMSDWPVKFTAISVFRENNKRTREIKKGNKLSIIIYLEDETREEKRGDYQLVSLAYHSYGCHCYSLFSDRLSVWVVSEGGCRSLASKMDQYYASRPGSFFFQ